ncbi:hypothetical protein CSE_13890 [Caldisericum exile AZM16c01]|uniref:Uncharacterized protein n=1 Tax=Caldisericum exile (strain DSM 21853 / NBRC 104410 / AZM16c01) TaxID=511051 RepID=A0A7U6JGH8_CALEA|nr:hypothetical protein CSE_13890 [Caldisericum exile AZM16c01]
MNEECAKKLFAGPITTDMLTDCAIRILKHVEMIDMDKKIMLRYITYCFSCFF